MSPRNRLLARSLARGLALLVLIVVLLSLTSRQCYLLNPPPPSAIHEFQFYSDFIAEAERGNIKTVTFLSDGIITGELKQSINGKTSFGLKIFPPSMDFIESQRKTLVEKNPQAKTETKTVQPSGLGNFIGNWGPPIFFIFIFYFFMRRARGQKNETLSFGKSRAKLSHQTKKVTFADVAGQDEAKEELQEIVDFLKEPRKFQRLGGKIPKGVLLIGPPGTGKTLIARAVAGEANVPFFSISGSDFVEIFVGVGASRVRDLFEQGKKNAPCIIFIDELDAVGRHRGAGFGGGHDEREQTLNQLLVELDGFESNEGVIITAATNRPDILDPALVRPGRFDRKVVLSRPDVRGREGILKIHTSHIPLADNVDLSVVAKGTPGLSGADLANLVNEAALNAARRNRSKVTNEDFEFAKDKVILGAEKRSLIISDKEKRITATHEAGHALIATLVPEVDPIHKVTIIPRGLALGLTSMLPEDKHNCSKTEAESQLTVLLGGRCAEEILLGLITSGASNDFERATELAKRMVCEWGMSENIGLLRYESDNENPFLGKSFGKSARNHSEETAWKIDQEVNRIVLKQYKQAQTLIQDNKEAVLRLAEELIARETLTGEEVKQIINYKERA